MVRRILLLGFALLLAIVAIATWGSIGSAALIFCLLMMGASLLYQHFLTNRENDDWQFDM